MQLEVQIRERDEAGVLTKSYVASAVGEKGAGERVDVIVCLVLSSLYAGG